MKLMKKVIKYMKCFVTADNSVDVTINSTLDGKVVPVLNDLDGQNGPFPCVFSLPIFTLF